MRLHFKKGDCFEMETITKSLDNQKIQDWDVKSTTVTKIKNLITVRNVVFDTLAEIELTYLENEFFYHGANTQSDKPNWDTLVKGEGENSKMRRLMNGSKLRMYLSSSGKVTNISGIEEIVNKIKSYRIIENDSERESYIKWQMKDFGEEIKKQMEAQWRYLPDHVVGIGDIWQQENASEISEWQMYQITNVLQETSLDHWTIDQHAEDTVMVDNEDGKSVIHMKIKFRSKGLSKINADDGISGNSETKTHQSVYLSGVDLKSGTEWATSVERELIISYNVVKK